MTDYERATTRETRVSESGRTVSSTTDEPVTTIRTTDRSYTAAGPDGLLGQSAASVAFIFGVLQALLIVRLVLLLLVANPGNDIVSFILSVTNPFVEPFRGMFALDRVGASQGSVFDVAALVALIAWTLIEALVIQALRIFAAGDRSEI